MGRRLGLSADAVHVARILRTIDPAIALTPPFARIVGDVSPAPSPDAGVAAGVDAAGASPRATEG